MNPNYSLHEVYLSWLIAPNPRQFLQDNDIYLSEITSFRGDKFNTWGVWIS